jgi:hypothetical protein
MLWICMMIHHDVSTAVGISVIAAIGGVAKKGF